MRFWVEIVEEILEAWVCMPPWKIPSRLNFKTDHQHIQKKSFGEEPAFVKSDP
jgi:hypothetical protein